MTEQDQPVTTVDEWKKYRMKIQSHLENHQASRKRVIDSPALQGESWRQGMIRHYDNLIDQKELELESVGKIIDDLQHSEGESATVR